ncbi:hypothetical protein [Streptomyces wuyuanensis]|uniref:YD repeat-containing protein n=1 Tax=Streptomyces wuyuanensis TaxID=1196353 RepID=A0A1G9TU06_9ACTN|nr:hypothetical protein [Streptomyces wuyuanensis]SDM51041.1 hypothetical protein SAMN05444921_109103 [Streptomyces wuyuanensis]
MNKLIRLTAATTASAALAGLVLIGTAGAASAESRTAVQQERNASITVTERGDERRQDRGDGPRHDRDGRWDRDGRHDRDGRWDRNGHGQWRHGKDGHWYWHGDDRRTYYRYDGHRFARWIDGKWVIVLLDRGHDVDRWYFDQVLDARQNDGRRV